MGGGGSDALREGKKWVAQDASACLGEGRSVKASPFLGIYSLFIGDRRGALPGWGSPSGPSFPPCLASLPPLHFFCATVTRGLGEQQRGQAQVALRWERAMAEAWGLQGLPRAPFCPPLQMMGVNSSGGQLGRGGASWQPSAARPHLPLGSILLINTGSGTGLRCSPWRRREGGSSAHTQILSSTNVA